MVISMKRIYILVVCIVLTMVSCSSNGGKDNVENVMTLTLWHYYHGVQQAAFDDLIKEFNTTTGLEKGIVVEAFSYGGVNELSESVFLAATEEAGSPDMPDIFSSYSDSAYMLKEIDKLADISTYFSEDEMELYISKYVEEGKIIDDSLSVFPVAKATEVLMLNKTDWDLFEEAVNGSSTYSDVSLDMLETWEGIQEVSEIYYQWTDDMTPDIEHDGKAFFGIDSSANYFYIASKQLGIELVDILRNDSDIDEGVVRKLWDTFYVPMVKGHFGAYGRFRSDDVRTGDLLCFIGSTSSAAYFPLEVIKDSGESYEIDAYVSTYPVFENASPVVIQQGAGMCITKSDEAREKAAVEFIKWFTEPERNIQFAAQSAGYFPVTYEAVERMLETEEIHALQTSDKESDRNLYLVITESLKQIGEYQLYFSPVFEGTADLRARFDLVKTDAADIRKAVVDFMAMNQADYEQEIQKLIDDDAFDKWLQQFIG